MPGTVAVLGDTVYERGTAEEYRDCYSWARFRARTRRRARQPRVRNRQRPPPRSRTSSCPTRGYYSYGSGAWHVVVLNSNCAPAGGCDEGSPQQRWLAAELALSARACTLAYMHHPRFSSGLHGSDELDRAALADAARAAAPTSCSRVTTTTTSASRRSTGSARSSSAPAAAATTRSSGGSRGRGASS